MGNTNSKSKLLHYTKFNNSNEALLATYMIDHYNKSYQPDSNNYFGINTKISLLSLLSNLINVPNSKIDDNIVLMRNVLINDIKQCLNLNKLKKDPITYYSDLLEIKIDDYIFKLIAKRQYAEYDRIHLLVVSISKNTGSKRGMIFYKSNSEGGIWRFAVMSGTQYLKNKNDLGGYVDYITETFINMKLQQFISDNLHKVPYSFYVNDLVPNYLNSTSKNVLYYNKNHTEISDDAIDNIGLYLSNFNIINSEDNIFYNRPDYDDTKYPYFNILRHNISCGFPIEFDSLVKMKTYFNTPANFNHPDKLRYATILKDIINYNFTDTIKNRNMNYHKIYYTILSIYLRRIGLIFHQPSLKYLYSNTAIIEPDLVTKNKYKFNMINQYYSIEIRVNSDYFLLYFTVYSPIINGKTIRSKNYRNIINVVEANNQILSTGQNSSILSIGNYICKVVEYLDQKQTSIDATSTLSESCEVHFDKIKINNHYVFIGHCANDPPVYPLDDIIIPDLPAVCIQSPQESRLYYPPKR